MKVVGLYVGKSATHLYFASWYGSPNFCVSKNKVVEYKVSDKNPKLVTFKNLEDVELLPYGFDFSKAVVKTSKIKTTSN